MCKKFVDGTFLHILTCKYVSPSVQETVQMWCYKALPGMPEYPGMGRYGIIWQFLVLLVWRAFDASWQVTGKLFKQRTLENQRFQCSLFEQAEHLYYFLSP